MKRGKPLRSDPDKTREWQRRSRRNNSLKRSSRLSRGKRMKQTNPERKKKRRERDFGDKAEWLKRNEPCLVCGKLPTEPHHYPSRGAGGTSKDLVGLCNHHHRQFHTLGAESWQELHEIDLTEEAKATERRWLEHQGERE